MEKKAKSKQQKANNKNKKQRNGKRNGDVLGAEIKKEFFLFF